MIDDIGGWKQVLGTLANSESLSRHDARTAMATILSGEATTAQIAAYIVALRLKGETAEELGGMVEAMVEAADGITLPEHTIDIVGAGGSPFRRRHALNVSTMACFVAAAAGASVCKHGNRKASSTSGSFDLLEALGVNIDLDSAGVERCVAEAGVGFAFARAHHPAMRFAAPVRAELGIPTVFNILGPISHPGQVTRQVMGVASETTADLIAQVLADRGVRAIVVTGDDDLDEFSLTGPSRVLDVADGSISEMHVAPSDVGMEQCAEAELAGGDAAKNAAITQAIFSGEEQGPRRDIVVLNAAAGLVVAGLADDLTDGVAQAAAVIDTGSVATTLSRLVEVSHA